MKIKSFLLFLSGAIFYDGLNHLILAFRNSPYSVHGIEIGVSANWTIFVFNWLVVAAVLIFTCKSKTKK